MVRAPTALEIVVFDLGRHRFGLAVPDVERVVRAVASTPLPQAPAIVEGLISLAGQPIAVIDLRQRFGLPARIPESADMMLVARAGQRRVAIRADRVRGLARISAADVHAANGVTPMAQAVSGVVTLPDGVVLLQDPQAFLTEAEATDLAVLIEPTS